jgi:flagellar hook-associated protein 3 FlgL
MRITGHHMMATHAKNVAAAQEDVARLADQISSGRAVRRASDDPVAWAQARRDELRATLSRGRGDGLALANDQLAETERALTTIGNAVAEGRALAIQAANDSYGPIQRAMLRPTSTACSSWRCRPPTPRTPAAPTSWPAA